MATATATALPQPRTVLINNQTYAAFENRNINRSAFEHFEEFEKTSNGAFRFIQLLAKVASSVAMYFEYIGNSMASLFSNMAHKLNISWGLIGISRLPTVTKNCWKALTSWGTVEGPEGYALRGHVDRTHDVADCGAMWGYTLSALLESTPIRNVAEAFNAVSDGTDLIKAGEDRMTAERLIEHIDPANVALRQRFEETKTEATLRFLKTLASVTGTALGFFAIATGSAFALAISIASTVFALATHFYKEAIAQYTPVRFFEWVNPANLEGVYIN
jgi:hypothetical protein